MTAAAILCLIVLDGILVYLLAAALNRLQWANEEIMHVADVDHAKCIGAVAAFVGDHYAAQVLRVAAEDYDSITEQDRAKRIADLRYTSGGPSVPALWLHDRAERLLVLAEGESQ